MYVIVAAGREGRKTPTSSARTRSSDERKGTVGPETGGEVPGRDPAAQKTGTLFPIPPASVNFNRQSRMKTIKTSPLCLLYLSDIY